MDWPKEVIIEFLHLYKKEPVLWNPKEQNYKNRTTQHEAWKRIETNLSMQCSIVDLKRKKEALMATYRRLCRKVKHFRTRGEYYKPEWFAYKFMANFLSSVYNPVKTEDELLEDVTIEESILEEQGDGHLDSGETLTFEFETDDIVSGEEKIKHGSVKSSAEPPRDECSMYTELLAKKLRSMDEQTRGLAMLEIDQLVYKLRYQSPHSSRDFSRADPLRMVEVNSSVEASKTAQIKTSPSPRSSRSPSP
ncbi:hypothetical protein NQ315_010917 [Exocentrus adspersus]|uniref:MADF domain-containing protein n=1 Tax=Exocentrus adspersus TaxID=1586481 RepID=A0AAV8VQ05_9CUCU|nr:hypothetical protein NQ315_010917 [Exocentrus adspersus]